MSDSWVFAGIEASRAAADARQAHEEAASWSRVGWIASDRDPYWRVLCGMHLVNGGNSAYAARDWRRMTRCARQARAALSAFRHPSGLDALDRLIESAESLYCEGCDRLGLPGPDGFRAGADTDLSGEWLSTLSAHDLRMVDFSQIA